uniref:uncharacterized protein LOC117713418 n=1 Tax=Arvicanthis niloticus TaxID=61156 RepID=UPI00148646A0|nr:uncharacterized protein LOC117713418 [Arvicanthis niloticus]
MGLSIILREIKFSELSTIVFLQDTFTPCTLARLRNNESLAKFLVDKRDQILKADELKRLKRKKRKKKVRIHLPTEDSGQLQLILDGTSLVTEEADKQKVIRLQLAENLNDSWVHASEDQIQSVVHASESGNHSAIHVSENLNPSSAYTSENESQTEVPAVLNLMNSVVQEAENPNHSAAALVLQKQDGKTEEQPVPVEENREDDGLNSVKLKIKVEPEHPTEDSEQPQVILDGTSLVTEEADKQKVIRLQSTKNLNDSWVHASEDELQSVVHASENGNHSAIHVSENLNLNEQCGA